MTIESPKTQIIENLYHSNMWVTDLHYQALRDYADQDSYTEEDLIALIRDNADSAKRSFSTVFQRMGNKNAYYSVPICVFEVGQLSYVRIVCKYRFQRLVGTYKVVISPFYNYDYRAGCKFEPDTITVDAADNCICIPYIFKAEDMYHINVFYQLDSDELLLLSTDVYALESDLFQFNFYKADLHMHTTYSDGYEPPELVVTSAREHGMDIVAVTDHNEFYGSVSARDKVQKMGLDMTVILGEEYSLEYSPMHILAFGTQKPIERKYLTKAVLDMPETQKIIQETKALSCDVRAYAGTQVLLDEVTRIGGISILAHPYWKPIGLSGFRMDTPENMYIELARNKKFTGIELVSGSLDGEVHVSNMQSSLARTFLGAFDDIPVIGITDSHYYTIDPIAGKHYTIILAKSKDEQDVLEALRCGRCVAVELINGTALCYGTHRLAKLAEFLIRYYFPDRDATAKKEAQSIKEQYLLRS